MPAIHYYEYITNLNCRTRTNTHKLYIKVSLTLAELALLSALTQQMPAFSSATDDRNFVLCQKVKLSFFLSFSFVLSLCAFTVWIPGFVTRNKERERERGRTRKWGEYEHIETA